MGLDEMEQEEQKMKDPKDNIFIVTVICLGFIVLLSLYMLVVVL